MNKRQKWIQTEEQIKQSQMNAFSNPFSCVSLKKSNGNVEKSFTDKRLSFLFRKCAPKIKDEGYRVSPNRRKNRLNRKRAPSEQSSLSKSGIVGNIIALPKESSLSILPDHPKNLDSSNELSGEHFDLSDQ
jgi:hypothetical protein